MSQYRIRQSVSEALEMIIANCNQKPQSVDILLKAWHIGLADLTDEQINYGLFRILERPSGFLPPVGEFRQYATTAQGCNSIESEAEEMWALVVANLNYYASPVFKNTAIAEAIRKMGGWQMLCSMEMDELPFRRKDFISLYCTFKRRNDIYDPDLIGFGSIPTLKFIGFESQEEINAVHLQIENRKSNERKLINLFSSTSTIKQLPPSKA